MTAGAAGVRVLAAGVAAGAISAPAVARSVTRAVRERDAGPRGLHAFLSHDPRLVEARAVALDRELAGARDRGESPGRLTGVPIGLKDNLCTLDHPTSCGSRMLEGYTSPYEATVVRRLRSEGALLVGKTNMDEFAMGSSTENSAFGPTLNPHDPERVPGGSSGGSAAAVAAGLVAAALGSETGGSIRQPASLCGVVGLKPTWGRVSRYGLVAFASSLDQVGTLGRTVEDAALLLEVIAGRDPLDSTCLDQPPPMLLDGLEAGIAGLTVGIPEEYFPPELDDGVRACCDRVIDALAAAGATIRRLSLPHTRYAVPAYHVIAPAEASSNLARYDGVRFGRRVPGDSAADVQAATRAAGFGAEVKRRILIGTLVLSGGLEGRHYASAQRVRRAITAELDRAFEDGVDVLFTPTTAGPAFRFGERLDEPYRMYLADRFTVPANLAGLPALSVPIGAVDGLPVGGQIIAPRWREATLVRAGRAVERLTAGGAAGWSAAGAWESPAP